MLSNFIDRIKLPFRKDKELYLCLYKIIGFYPRKIDYYKTALLHKSIARRNEKGKPVNNERLEFLGDAILDAVVGDIVFEHFPGKREGFLTNTRSKLVQRDTLGRLAQEMGINELILSNGRGTSHNSYMGGNAFEALVGAIYLDRGYDACMKFMKKRILAQMINIDKVAYKEVNFKSKMLEWSQKNRVQIEFRLIDQKKDDQGNQIFNYQVFIEGIAGCSGKGYSKKESQQMASKLTLEQLRKKPQFIDAVFAAKSDRTKMEEEPAMAVPKTEEQEDFIIVSNTEKPVQIVQEKPSVEPKEVQKPQRVKKAPAEKEPVQEAPIAPESQEKKERPASRRNRRNKPSAATAEPAAATPEKPAEPTQKSKPSRRNKEKAVPSDDREEKPRQAKHRKSRTPKPVPEPAPNDDDEFDLSDITAREQTREEIIAAAEAAAYGPEE
ncbi:MAG: ribonuclease III [Prevotella sp.]|nr:ribonuclease III [Prevotella sp.]